MDVALSKEKQVTRTKKRILITAVVLITLAAAVWLLRMSIRSSVSYGALRIAVVEKGEVINTIQASGLIQPEFEETISSPIASSIKNILLDVGTSVKPGESILTLDKTAAQAEYERLKLQSDLNRGYIRKVKLEQNKNYYDMRANNEIKQLQINSLMAAVENAKRLYKAGGGTKETIELEELKLKTAQIEKKQIEKELSIKHQTMAVEINESEIEATIQRTNLQDLERKLSQATIKSSRAGVITWVNKNIGTVIKEGEPLARVADLGSYKVTGSISDSYLDQLKPGMQALIKINDVPLRAVVSSVLPAVQNGFISFELALTEKNNSLYRPNMKVDIFLITQIHAATLRVANGAAFKGGADQFVYAVQGNKAVRKKIRTGLSNFDFVEISGGLAEGERIIISDMNNYNNIDEVTIKK